MLLAAMPRGARAEPAATPDEVAETANLDGYYIALGPRGGALFGEGEWDGAFGAEASIYRYRAAEPLSLLGVSGGLVQLSELPGGHAYTEIGVGADLGPLLGGVALGVTARTNPVRHTRWGGHATLWAFAGAVPYARVGALQDTGIFADFGIRLAIPALAW